VGSDPRRGRQRDHPRRDVDAGYESVLILKDVNFEVRRGEVFGILGRSGGGKSTLMKHIIGLNPPLAGHIYIDGDDIVTAGEQQLEQIQRRFGVMYQSERCSAR
jgi:phospholipid/cholesterol/gamma-HCH transport system ATP-binding protein